MDYRRFCDFQFKKISGFKENAWITASADPGIVNYISRHIIPSLTDAQQWRGLILQELWY